MIVAHADLPHARPGALERFATIAPGIVTIVPCHRDDGTPVLSVPAGAGFAFAYGPGSARRHAAIARGLGLAVHIVRDPELGFDVDVPADLDGPRSTPGPVSDVPSDPPLPAPRCASRSAPTPTTSSSAAGGTLAKWAAAGTEVHLLVLTDGSKGTWDADDDLGPARRDRVSRKRAPPRPRWPEPSCTSWVRRRRARLGRSTPAARCVPPCATVRPDVVLGHDPWQRYRLHPDHRHAGWATVDGIVAARDPHFFPGSAARITVPTRCCCSRPTNRTMSEPIDDTIDVKVDALLCHRSQWRSTMDVDPTAPDLDAAIARFRARVHDAARSDDGELVERYRLLTDL